MLWFSRGPVITGGFGKSPGLEEGCLAAPSLLQLGERLAPRAGFGEGHKNTSPSRERRWLEMEEPRSVLLPVPTVLKAGPPAPPRAKTKRG